METSLRKAFERTEVEIATFKNPDTTPFEVAIQPVLAALGCPNFLKGANIDFLEIDEGTVRINITYSCRGCLSTDQVSFPEAVLDSADPVREATHYRLMAAIAEQEEALHVAEKRVQESKSKLEILRRELMALSSGYVTSIN